MTEVNRIPRGMEGATPYPACADVEDVPSAWLPHRFQTPMAGGAS